MLILTAEPGADLRGSGGQAGHLTLAMSTGSPLREASSMGSSPLAWRRCILAPSTSFFCLARRAACRSCFLRVSRKASCCWAVGKRDLVLLGSMQRGPIAVGLCAKGMCENWAVCKGDMLPLKCVHRGQV